MAAVLHSLENNILHELPSLQLAILQSTSVEELHAVLQKAFLLLGIHDSSVVVKLHGEPDTHFITLFESSLCESAALQYVLHVREKGITDGIAMAFVKDFDVCHLSCGNLGELYYAIPLTETPTFETTELSVLKSLFISSFQQFYIQCKLPGFQTYRFPEIFDHLPVSLALYNNSGQFVYVNQNFVHGILAPVTVLGKTDTVIGEKLGYQSGIGERRVKELKNVIGNRKAVSFEEVLVDEKGRERNILREIIPLPAKAGIADIIVSCGVDISNLRQSHDLLYNSERQLSFVLNTVGEGIILFNNDNVIIFANREAEKIWGYEHGTLAGSFVHKLLEETENAPPALINFLLNPTEDSEILGKELEFVGFRKDRKRFPLSAKIQNTKIGDNHYYTAALEDITERKIFLEQLMSAKNEAEHSMRAKEEFLAHISHEIRTPLNAICGLTELLLHLSPSGEQERFTSAIKVASDTLLLLINDVLDVSKIQAGKVQLQDFKFNLTDIFSYIYGMLQVASEAKKIELRYDIDSSIPEMFFGDAIRLSQIILNLVSNAVKFTETGSVLYTARVVATADEFSEVAIEVIDTGIGIPEEQLKNIFDSFNQVLPFDKKYGRGSGLGLTISKSLAHMFGGEIRVKSNKGQGTTFTCHIPLRTTPIHGKIYKSYRQFENYSVDLSGIRVLIVEDNDLNIMVIKNMLEYGQAQYTLATNGQEAIDLLMATDYDIILMDISMPYMNGFEATLKIRNDFPEPKRNIPIVALTATTTSSGSKEFLQSGMNDFLAKPFQFIDLASKILLYAKKGRILKEANVFLQPTAEKVKPKPYNLLYLQETFGANPPAIGSFLSKYLEQTTDSIRNIKYNCGQRNIAEIKRVAHKIKSGSKYIGADEFAAYFEQIEAGYFDYLPESQINEHLQNIEQEFEILKDEINTLINSL